MLSSNRNALEILLIEHEEIYGVGLASSFDLPVQAERAKSAAQNFVQTDLEEYIANIEVASEKSIDVSDERLYAGYKTSANSLQSNLGLKAVDFQSIEGRRSQVPSLLRVVQALHRSEGGAKSPPVCYCGLPRQAEIDIHLVDRDGRQKAGASGIWRCRNGEVCPHCAEIAKARRRANYSRLSDANRKQGGCIVALTLCISHNPDDRLSDLMRVVKTASTAARSGGTWARSIKPRLGCLGVLVDHHVRHSELSGWNYHQHLTIHCLETAPDAINSAVEMLISRYVACIKKQGYQASASRQHYRILSDRPESGAYTYPADHNFKRGTDHNVEAAELEREVSESLSPFMLAQRAGEGDQHSAKLFLEFSAAIRSTRSAILTAGLKNAFDLDEGQVIKPAFNEKNKLGSIPGAVWTRLIDRNLSGTFLTRVKVAGRAGWQKARCWALEQAFYTPIVSGQLTVECSELLKAADATGDEIAKDIATKQLEILRKERSFALGSEVVDRTIDYVRANYHAIKTDSHRVDYWMLALERMSGKQKRKGDASHMTLPLRDDASALEFVPHGSTRVAVAQNQPISQHVYSFVRHPL
jgi:hypothetical protein